MDPPAPPAPARPPDPPTAPPADRPTDPPAAAAAAPLLPVVLLSLAVVLLIPLDRPLPGLPPAARVPAGLACALGWAALALREAPARRRLWAALGAPLALLALAPIDTSLEPLRALTLGACLALALWLPRRLARGTGAIRDRLLPGRLDPVDLLYALASVPLAWGAFRLYFGELSPATPGNWALPAEPDPGAAFALFMGVNAVGVWDELFFVSAVYALLRGLYPARVANPAQAVVYTSVLWDMAFTGWGPLFVATLALTQGAMFERDRSLLWVLIVHLVVDAFLFSAIVEHHWPGLDVWWHP